MAKPDISPDFGYNIAITGKHFAVTDPIRNYVFEKLDKVDRLTDQVIDVFVILDSQKLIHTCAINLNFSHYQINVHASTENMYSAIDRCSDRLNKLIRRYKTKLQSHRFKDLATVDIHVNVVKPLEDDVKEINEDIEAENARIDREKYSMHHVVAQEMMKLKVLTQDEAVMKMEISTEPFLVFRCEEDQKLKVIYRRKDGDYGIILMQ